jgi:hypothetical protein
MIFRFSFYLTGMPIGMPPRDRYDVSMLLSMLWYGLTDLLIFSTSFNVVPVVALYSYYSLQKRFSQKTNIAPSPIGSLNSALNFPRNIKLTLFAAVIYIGFIVVYGLFIRPEGPMTIYNKRGYEGTHLGSYILGYIIPLYFISFFSLLISMPSLIGRVKKGIAVCVLTPLFWNVVILAVYALMIFLTTWNTEFFSEGQYIFTLNYYLGRYFDTRAWFISFPLLAIWLFCHWLMKVPPWAAKPATTTPPRASP